MSLLPSYIVVLAPITCALFYAPKAHDSSAQPNGQPVWAARWGWAEESWPFRPFGGSRGSTARLPLLTPFKIGPRRGLVGCAVQPRFRPTCDNPCSQPVRKIRIGPGS